MHRDDGPPHWKLIQIQKLQKACGRLDGRTDGRKNGCTDGQTNGRKDGQMYGQTDEQTEGQMDRQIEILYCHFGDLNLWPDAACAARNYGLRALIVKK